ncbi:MAG: endolytic transglycosylase MltG [Myxococcota bacterium]|nr:endolytic transglycosylase MltG [Myxococcota bacterium]
MIKRFVALAMLVVIGLGAYGYVRFSKLDEPVNPGESVIQVKIPTGASFRSVTKQLEAHGVIEDALFFELLGRYEGAERQIKAGDYLIQGHLSSREILKSILEGTLPRQIKVTIPEGFNRWQIADRLARHQVIERAAFLRAVQASNLEGRLFPETYLFGSNATLDSVIKRLTKQFDRQWAELLAESNRAVMNQADMERLIVLASLVQKESKHPGEQRKIARVILNRLSKNMKLQIDPTCVYGRRTYREKPHPRFCKNPNNRYSTYVHHGLTPGAISNPGRSALYAALNPYDGPDFDTLLFFVALGDGSGRHVFSATYAAHKKAVRNYIKRRQKEKSSRTHRGEHHERK